MFPIAAIAHYPVSTYNVCFQPYGLLPPLAIPEKTCPAIAIEEQLRPRIYASPPQQEVILNTFLALRRIEPAFAEYSDFVLAYLKNFIILVTERNNIVSENLPKTLPSGATLSTSGSYHPMSRTFILYNDFIQRDLISWFLHEWRHAFWNTIHKYAFADANYELSCFHPVNLEQQRNFMQYIKLGDNRVAELKQDLLKESNGQLPANKIKKFAALRAECERTAAAYYFVKKYKFTNLNINDPDIQNLVIGSVVNFRDYPEVGLLGGVGRLLGLKPLDNGVGVELEVELLDPLRRLVYTVQQSQLNMELGYQPSMHEFEREAALYTSVPMTLIREYWPELIAYTSTLARKVMKFPNPTGLAYLLPRPTNNIKSNLQTAYFSDQNYLDFVVKNGKLHDFLVEVDHAVKWQHLTKMDFNLIRYTLNNLLQRGIKTAEINLVLARLSDKENDNLGACRHYHRAFKSDVEFTYRDYIICIDRLIKANNYGEAKIVCQKAKALYKAQYNYIPVELTERWNTIKKIRKGRL